MNLKRGKKPARPDAVQLRFASYFKAANLPAVPAVIGRPWLIRQFGMLGNDMYGNCVWAGAAHETMMLCADAGSIVPTFTTKTVLADYSAVTGFNANDLTTDLGTDVQDAAKYRQRTGIIDILGNRHKIDVYTALRIGDLDELALAVFLFGSVGIGVALPPSAEPQFDHGEIWDVEPNTPGGDGHYIPCIGRNSRGDFLFVTWSRLQAATPQWVRQYMDEGICFFSRERLKASGLSPQGFDAAALNDDFRQVTES